MKEHTSMEQILPPPPPPAVEEDTKKKIVELDTWFWAHTSDNSLNINFSDGSLVTLTPETLANILSTFPGDYGTDILAQHGKHRFERVRSVTPSDEE